MNAKAVYILIIFIIPCILISSCNLKETRRDRYFIKGNEALDERAFDKAFKFYDNALDIDPGFSEAWNNKGIIFYAR